MMLRITINYGRGAIYYNRGEQRIYLAERVESVSRNTIRIYGELDSELVSIEGATYSMDLCDPAPAIRGDEGYEDYSIVH